MININKNIRKLPLLIALLLSQPVSSAKYELNENTWTSDNEKNSLLNPDYSSVFEQEKARHVKDNYQLVLRLIKQGQREQAAQQLELFIKEDPKQSVYYNLKALLAILDKNVEQAKEYYQQAVKLNAKNLQALQGLAKLALDNKQYDKARQYANQVLAINNQAINSYKILADIALQQEGIDAAEKVLLNAYSQVKGNFSAEKELIKQIGKIYVNKKQPEKLLALASDLAERYPDKPDALLLLAEAQVINLNTAEAEQTLRKIIARQPEEANYRFLLAKLLSKQKGRESEVLALLDEAAERLDNPNLVLAYKTAFLIQQKQIDKAYTVAQQVEKKSPQLSIGKILLGDVFFAQKKYPQALQKYQQAYAITPTINILDAQQRVLLAQNKAVELIALLNKELKKNEDNDLIRMRLADAYQNIGQYSDAIKHYQVLLSKNPENVVLLNNLAWAYYKQNKPEALDLARKAYEKAPKAAAIADTYGLILLKNGKAQQALEILKKAAEAAPGLAEVQLHLAEAYYANQNKQQAKQILQALIDRHSSNQQQAQKLLAEWK